MIELKPKIKNDLSSSINNFDLLFVINHSLKTYYLSTQSQTLDGIYYDDLIMKVGGLKESINLRDKKIKLSGTSITINNSEISGIRFSDTIVGEMSGGIVDIYIKTQSCESLEDCMTIASLKITGITHNSSDITLQCEDRFIDEFHKELPRVDDTLYEGKNTFVGDNERRIPILYGQLENAPAVLFINNNTIESAFADNNIFIIPDRAFLDNSDIVGIKPISPFALDDTTSPNQLINNSSLSIKLGDNAASVYSQPPDRANKIITQGLKENNYEYEIDWNTQYTLNDNNTAVVLNTAQDSNSPKFISTGNLLCSEISKLKKANVYVIRYAFMLYPIYNSIIAQKQFLLEQKFNIKDKYSDMLSVINYAIDIEELSYNDHKFGDYRSFDVPIFELEFEPIKSSVSISEGKEKRIITDGNMIGAFNNNIEAEYVGAGSKDEPLALEYCIFPQQANFISKPSEEIDESNWTETDIGIVDLIADEVTSSDDEEFNAWDQHDYDYMPKLARRFQEKSPLRIRTSMPISNVEGTFFSQDNRNTFQTTAQQELDNEINTWRMDDEWIDSANWLDTNIFTGYIVPTWDLTQQSSWGGGWTENGDSLLMNIQSEFKSMIYKRNWYQSEVFNKDFFLNARGRAKTIDNILIDNYNKIIKVENLQIKYKSSNNLENGVEELEQENTLLEVYDYLTNRKFKNLYFQNERYDLVIDGQIQNKNITLYDIDVSEFTTDINATDSIYQFLSNATILRKDSGGSWVDLNNESISSMSLRYGKKIYQDGVLSGFEYLDEATDLIDAFPKNAIFDESDIRTRIDFGDANTQDNDYVFANFDPFTTNILVDNEEVKEMIKKPSDVIDDLMKRELGLEEDINRVNVIDDNYELDFSIYKDEKGIDILKKISQSSPLFYRTSLYSGIPSVVGIKNTYTDDDIDKSINVNQIMRHKYSKSKIEDVAVKCRVKYGYDYVKEEYTKTTEDIKHRFPQSHITLYDIKDEDSYTLEYEAEYIQDDLSANLLAKHLFELNKNQHLLLSFQIPLGDAIELEIGDIIDFIDNMGNRTNINNTKPYGMDMSIENTIIDQLVYPYFMITSIKKDLTKVDIECVQLHKLEEEEYGEQEFYDYQVGDVNLDQNLDIFDVLTIMDMIEGGGFNNPDYTDQQKELANLDGNATINILDAIQLMNLILGND